MANLHHLKLQLFRLKAGQNWNAPHEGLLFLFARAGAGEYHCDPPASAPVTPEPAVQVQSLSAGDVLLLQAAAASRGRVRAAVDAEFAFCAFSLCPESLYPILTADEIPLVQPLMERLNTARFYPATQPTAARWQQLIRNIAPEFDLEHRSQLLRVASAILAEELKNLQPPLSHYEHGDARVTRLFDQLSVEQILGLSVAKLAGRFGCSQRHLNRLFHEHFGLPVGTLRMEMRMLKAISLLRNPDLTILRVAEQCGFNHLGLFNACFKRRFGSSPGHWRKHLESEHDPARVRVDANGAPRCRLSEIGLCPWLEPQTGGAAEVQSPDSAVRGPSVPVSQCPSVP